MFFYDRDSPFYFRESFSHFFSEESSTFYNINKIITFKDRANQPCIEMNYGYCLNDTFFYIIM